MVNKTIKYGIPSHKRSDNCKTYNLLKSLGISDSDIVISLNKKEDIKPYSTTFPNANIIYTETKNVAMNRNNILKYFKNNERIVLLDDDINKFEKLTNYKTQDKGELKEITTAKELNQIWNNAFDTAKLLNIKLIGVYPTNDRLFMTNMVKRNGIYGINYLICGSAVGIINNDIYFNEKFDLLEDYELVLRLLNNNQNILRINNFGAKRSQTGKTKGGNSTLYENKKDYDAMQILEKEYGHLFKKHIKKNGVLGLKLKPSLKKIFSKELEKYKGENND